MATEVLLCPLIIHRGFEGALRLCNHPERTRRRSLEEEQLLSECLTALLDSLQTEVTRPHSWFLLVELEEAGGGAEDACVVFPLVNRFSIHQGLLAGGAGRRQVPAGERGLCRLGLPRQREDRPNLQVLLWEPEQEMKHAAHSGTSSLYKLY